jgi:hypothetical protein
VKNYVVIHDDVYKLLRDISISMGALKMRVLENASTGKCEYWKVRVLESASTLVSTENESTENASTDDRLGKCEFGICEYGKCG